MSAWIGTVSDRDTQNREASVYIPEIGFQTSMMPVVGTSDIPGVGDSVAVVLSKSSDYDGVILGAMSTGNKITLNSDMDIGGKMVIDGDVEITGKLEVVDDAVIKDIPYSLHTHTVIHNSETGGPHYEEEQLNG